MCLQNAPAALVCELSRNRIVSYRINKLRGTYDVVLHGP